MWSKVGEIAQIGERENFSWSKRLSQQDVIGDMIQREKINTIPRKDTSSLTEVARSHSSISNRTTVLTKRKGAFLGEEREATWKV